MVLTRIWPTYQLIGELTLQLLNFVDHGLSVLQNLIQSLHLLLQAGHLVRLETALDLVRRLRHSGWRLNLAGFFELCSVSSAQSDFGKVYSVKGQNMKKLDCPSFPMVCGPML